MVSIQKGQIDSSVIVGIVVVLAIVSAVGFSVYYFGFVRPSQAELEESKNSAIQTLNQTLGEDDTPVAEEKVSVYKSKIQGADSKSEVTSIVEEISSVHSRESVREELLNTAKEGTHGSFYTLKSFYEGLRNDILNLSDLSSLNSFKDKIDGKINSAWTNYHEQAIENITGNEVVARKRNSSEAEIHLDSKENALQLIEGKSWDTLNSYKFREVGSFTVPIKDTFSRVPTVDKGSKVDVYEYDTNNDEMSLRASNLEVLKVIYPSETPLSTVRWKEGGQTNQVDVWEDIKADAAGVSSQLSFNDWAQNTVEKARDDANIGQYDLQAIYVLKVTVDDIAKELTHIEQFKSGQKDIILVERT